MRPRRGARWGCRRALCPARGSNPAPLPPVPLAQLFTAAAEASAAYSRWKTNGDSRPAHLLRSQSLKRKWAAEGSGNENAAAAGNAAG